MLIHHKSKNEDNPSIQIKRNENNMTVVLVFLLLTLNKYLLTNVSLLYPLKTSENLLLSDVFRRYKIRTLVENQQNEIIDNVLVSLHLMLT